MYQFRGSEQLTAIVQRVAGPHALPHSEQLAAVDALLSPSARVLVVQASGWGKSTIYLAATMAFRNMGRGPSLVISTDMGIVRQRVADARHAGLQAESININSRHEWNYIKHSLHHDLLDVLIVSTSHLGQPMYQTRLAQLQTQSPLIVLDEAHCASGLDGNFRPDYLRIARSLSVSASAAVLATTSSANLRVAEDLRRTLFNGSIVFRGTFVRSSVRLSVIPGLSPCERFTWIAEVLSSLPGSGVIYTRTDHEALILSAFLRKCRSDVAAYSSTINPVERHRIVQRLHANELKAVVSTSVRDFSHEVPNFRFCIHLGSPPTLDQYSRQVDCAAACVEAILIPSDTDEETWRVFETNRIPSQEDTTRVLESLLVRSQSISELESTTAIRRRRLSSILQNLALDGAATRIDRKWVATGQPWYFDRPKWNEISERRREDADLMRRYSEGDSCLMVRLQQVLNDSSPSPCGNCSVCARQVPGSRFRPSANSVKQARAYLRKQDFPIESPKVWPKGCARTGNVGANLTIRAVATAEDPGWTEELKELAHSLVPMVPKGLIAGAKGLLQRWTTDCLLFPELIIPAPAPDFEMSRNRYLANNLNTDRGLSVCDPFTWEGPPCPKNLPSLHHVQHLEKAIRLNNVVCPLSGTVVLCATTAVTLWTLTLAARKLVEAGAHDVMALVLHRRHAR